MTAAGLSIGGALVLAMIGVSAWAWRMLPPDVRIPVHLGVGGYGNFSSKTRGLITWPVAGAVIYGVEWGIAAMARGPLIGVPIVLAVVLAAQTGAIRAALRQPRSR